MAPVSNILRRTLLRLGAHGALTDRQLLERFVAQQDQAAFEEVVRRHGPMVLAVCRRVLQHVQDAEDAFQATFVVLARKAALVATRESVGGWLHCVASRTTCHAKKIRACRARETAMVKAGLPADHGTALPPAVNADELRSVLDEELAQLPERQRALLVLVYFEGKTAARAAEELGENASGVRVQLQRARERLRGRLARRGLGVSSAGLGAWLAEGSSSAALAPRLLASTVKAGQLAALGQLTFGAEASAVAALATSVLGEMAQARRKLWLALLALLVGIGLGTLGTVAFLPRGNTGGNAPAPLTQAIRPDVIHGPKVLQVLPVGKDRLLAFHPSAPLLAAGNRDDGTVTFWNTNSGAPESLPAQPNGLNGLAWSHGLAFSPDGKMLALNSWHDPVRLWNRATKDCTILPVKSVDWLQFSPDSALIAVHSGGQPTVRVWNTATAKEMHHFDLGSSRELVIFFSSAQETLVTLDDQGLVQSWSVNLWRSPSRPLTVARAVRTQVRTRGPGPLQITISPDARQVATFGDRSVEIHDLGKERLRTALSQDQRVRCGSYSPDGKLLAVCREHDVKLYDADSLEERATIPEEFVMGEGTWQPLFAPDGRTVAICKGDKVALWQVGLNTSDRSTRDNLRVQPASLAGRLPIQQDFRNGQAPYFVSQAGSWTVGGGTYNATPTSGPDVVSTLNVAGPLPAALQINVTANSDAPTQGASNGFVIFDYRSPTDFKYAGYRALAKEWVIGHRDSSGWHDDAKLANPALRPGTNHQFQVNLDGAQVLLSGNGVSRVSFMHPSAAEGGQVGLGTSISSTQFSNLQVQATSPPAGSRVASPPR
jgi:RNA polymerase sigma factor (sigma-70 family)